MPQPDEGSFKRESESCSADDNIIARYLYGRSEKRADARTHGGVVRDGETFAGGVHRKLCDADIRAQQADFGKGDGAERAAAAYVRTVIKFLERHVRVSENFFDCRGGKRAGGVRFIRVEFNHNAAARNGAVGGVAFFGMVGVQRVRVIRRKQKRGVQRFVIFVVVEFQRACQSAQRAFEKVSAGALQRAAAHFFVIENSRDANAACRAHACKRFYRGKNAG